MSSYGQSKDKGKIISGDFGKFKYDSVVLINFRNVKNNDFISNGKLNSVAIINKKTLTKCQIDTLNYYLFNTKTYGGYPPSCFNNQIGIIYFRLGKIVGHIGVSFECNSILPSVGIGAMQYENFHDDKYDFAFYSGLSKNGKTSILKLFNRLNFTVSK